jgi:hypothetical protein
MATVKYRTPIQGPQTLGPGESAWVDLGESDDFGDGAIAVTATPIIGRDGDTHVLKVENLNITLVQTNKGDITYNSYYAGCSVMNNGQTTITTWSVRVGVIGP